MSNIDDDRLLAFALGLDDDPELQAALAAQPLLQRRLDVIKADVARIQNDLQELVPPAGPAYERPAAERWRKLWPYLAAPAAKTAVAAGAAGNRGNRGLPAWRRVLVPAMALLVVVTIAVGVTVTLSSQGADTGATVSREAYQSSDKSANGISDRGYPDAYPDTLRHGVARSLCLAGKNAPLPSASGYATVVVARAGLAVAGGQSYTVVRTLKGKANAAVVVTLPAGILLPMLVPPPALAPLLAEDTVSVGALCLLYLQPAAGKPVLVLVLPAGATAASVRLP